MANVNKINPSKYLIYLAPLFIITLFTAFAALTIGSIDLSLRDIYSALFSYNENNINHQIITGIRLPRILLAVAVGGGLSVAGAVFQAVLLNPLAEPYILGVSSGGTFGAILSITLGLSFFSQQLFAFLGALLVIFLVFSLAKRFGIINPAMMLLTGVMIGAFFSALILLLLTFTKNSFRAALFWLLGNLSLAETETVKIILPIVLILSIALSLISQKLNVLSLGDETAENLGINSSAVRNISYILSSLLVGTVVSVSGIVGFIGLLVPHICRLILGLDNRLIIPSSFFIGSIFLLIADTIARTIILPAELPVGVITALIGAPIFIYLLRSRVQEGKFF